MRAKATTPQALFGLSLVLGASAWACSTGDGNVVAGGTAGANTGGSAPTAGAATAAGAAGTASAGTPGVGGAMAGSSTGGAGGTGPATTPICGQAAENESATLTCPTGSVITSVDFASYGTSTGECGSFVEGECHAADAKKLVEAECVGKSSCTVDAENATFGGDPCSFTEKHLDIQVGCSATSGGAAGAGTGGGGTDAGGAGGSSGGGASTGGWNEGTELKAFPTAEGYGRTAKGGRGGRVIRVTNLNDSGAGSLRDAVMATGPRTVVFDVSGVINLKSKLVISKNNPYLTVAGQTAPGKGVVVHGWTFGMIGGEHVILRFIRTRVGTSSGETMDGMGITGSPGPNIYDHCSISWTIDEAFSSRGTGQANFTVQRTMISEALNEAGHENYPAGAQHGFAASIGGDIGSFHHNLLAHCAGRNWSLAGGLGKNPVEFAGRLDIRNNVVYNWRGRTTDGGAHEVNFVNNYYKPGPASQIFVALNAQIENFPGTQSYYFTGNVMPGYFDEKSQDKGRKISYINRSGADWDIFVDKEFFEPYVKTQTAGEAYEDVLNNVGSNRPLDDHDTRIIKETREGKYTYSGSKTKFPGLIDNEKDVGGLENYPQEKRAANWDTDSDGMPDAWETSHGLSPSDATDGNKTTLSKLGYTNLEMYLNELAGDFK